MFLVKQVPGLGGGEDKYLGHFAKGQRSPVDVLPGTPGGNGLETVP